MTNPTDRRKYDRHYEAARRRRAATPITPWRRLSLFDAPGSSTILQRDRFYRRLLALADVVAAIAAAEAVVVAWGDRQPGPILLVLALVAVVIAKLLGLYDRDELLLHKSTLDESGSIFQLSTLFALFASLADSGLTGAKLEPKQVFVLWGLMFTFTLLARWAARHIAHRIVPAERCLLVGHASGMSAIGDRLEVGGGVNAVLVGEHSLDVERDRSVAMRELEDRVRAEDVHRVILAPAAADHEVVLDIVRLIKSLGVKVSLVPRLFEVVGSSVVFDHIGGMTVLGVRRFGLTRSSAFLKRSVDIAGAGLGLIVTAPIVAVIALAIRRDGPGPILFRQQRVGRDGKCFEMLKFRSMVPNADAMKRELVEAQAHASDDLFKLTDDPRLTRAGRLLRRTSLDELPQLINVWRGDMSLVGPRPLVVDEDRLVRGWQRRRLHLTPGMTGPWQIVGSGSKRVPLHEMANMDYLYIANWTVFTDVKILLRTVLHMVRRGGV